MALQAAGGGKRLLGHPRAKSPALNGVLRPPGNTYFLLGTTTYISHLPTYIFRLLAMQHMVTQVKAKVC